MPWMNKADVTIYDAAERHYGSEHWPEGLPAEQAYVHTGIYFRWVIENDLLAPTFAAEHARAVGAVKAGQLSGPKFYEQVGGVFRSDMLNERGRAFTDDYFTLGVGLYLRDYGNLIANRTETAYHVEDTPTIYQRIADRIDMRYRQWQASAGP